MRSHYRHIEPRTNPLLQCIVDAVAAIASAFMAIGDVMTPGAHIRKKSDRSEPPDLRAAMRYA